MNRRRFLALAASPLLTARPALATTTCGATPFGVSCRSAVPFGSFAQQAYQSQAMPQWCWAACISMVFSYYRHPVSQARIVTEVYGAPVNMPAGAGIVIARQLNRAWIDDHGRPFQAQVTAAYDFDARVFNVSNAWLINELEQNRPVIIGTFTHAVVMTAMDYMQTPIGPNPTAVGVFDPWPGRGARNLSPAEMIPMHLQGGLRFAATIRVL
jgi:hypothetical protein